MNRRNFLIGAAVAAVLPMRAQPEPLPRVVMKPLGEVTPGTHLFRVYATTAADDAVDAFSYLIHGMERKPLIHQFYDTTAAPSFSKEHLDRLHELMHKPSEPWSWEEARRRAREAKEWRTIDEATDFPPRWWNEIGMKLQWR